MFNSIINMCLFVADAAVKRGETFARSIFNNNNNMVTLLLALAHIKRFDLYRL